MIEDVIHAEPLDTVLAKEHAELAGVEVISVVGDSGIFRCRYLFGSFVVRA